MVRSLCSSGNGVEVVIGVPGSGKTFALDAARRACSRPDIRVYGAALGRGPPLSSKQDRGFPR